MVALKNIAGLMSGDGILFLDVNNRYNVTHYGLMSVLRNIIKDIFISDDSNGDFDLNFNTEKGQIHTKVHIFSPSEIESLVKTAGFVILKRKIINYKTGRKSSSVLGGQLVYKLCKI